MTKKGRRYSIKDLDTLITSIKAHYNLTEEDIVKRVNYNEGYISQSRSRGMVSEKFVEALKREFAKSNEETLQKDAPVNQSKPQQGAVPDYRDEFILLLKAENLRLKRDLDKSLGDLRKNALLARSVAETNQDLLIEILSKQRRSSIETISLEVGKANVEKYKALKEEYNLDGADT
jgi:hypothetical protein